MIVNNDKIKNVNRVIFQQENPLSTPANVMFSIWNGLSCWVYSVLAVVMGRIPLLFHVLANRCRHVNNQASRQGSILL